MKTSRFGLALVCVWGILLTAAQAAEGWGKDYDAALKQAAAEKRMVLLDFTGSDWCPPCKMMTKEVLTNKEFLSFAGQNLELVELDFTPYGQAKPSAFKKQHEELAEKYGVEAFPTFVLLDASGKEVARKVGFVPGGPAAFIKWIQGAPKG